MESQSNEAGGRAADSITRWMNRLQVSDGRAPEILWTEYFSRLANLARQRVKGLRHVDEEDVALSALDSFFRGAQQGRFSQLADREDLWKLLVTITARKAAQRRRAEYAMKRGGGQMVNEAQIDAGGDDRALEQFFSSEPTAESAAMLAESCRELLSQLPDDGLRAVALLRMEAFNNQEIAEQLDVSLRTVERRVNLIRLTWSEKAGS